MNAHGIKRVPDEIRDIEVTNDETALASSSLTSVIIIIIDSITPVFNIDASLPYNHALFKSFMAIGNSTQVSTNMFGCNTLSVPSCHATRGKHEGWDTARLPKPRQGKSREIVVHQYIQKNTVRWFFHNVHITVGNDTGLILMVTHHKESEFWIISHIPRCDGSPLPREVDQIETTSLDTNKPYKDQSSQMAKPRSFSVLLQKDNRICGHNPQILRPSVRSLDFLLLRKSTEPTVLGSLNIREVRLTLGSGGIRRCVGQVPRTHSEGLIFIPSKNERQYGLLSEISVSGCKLHFFEIITATHDFDVQKVLTTSLMYPCYINLIPLASLNTCFSDLVAYTKDENPGSARVRLDSPEYDENRCRCAIRLVLTALCHHCSKIRWFLESHVTHVIVGMIRSGHRVLSNSILNLIFEFVKPTCGEAMYREYQQGGDGRLLKKPY
ncbi:hypothetical protein CLF_100448 [Clonorchis sinensis]|uniref:Uncharacterized protein n=1 Tax=Clonorchis sinensis TaxID=79923 RepID=G7Y3G9_CLOSI|nr:hypothetical protein CLF_100448 [Clonorchis sinensis]